MGSTPQGCLRSERSDAVELKYYPVICLAACTGCAPDGCATSVETGQKISGSEPGTKLARVRRFFLPPHAHVTTLGGPLAAKTILVHFQQPGLADLPPGTDGERVHALLIFRDLS